MVNVRGLELGFWIRVGHFRAKLRGGDGCPRGKSGHIQHYVVLAVSFCKRRTSGLATAVRDSRN